MKRAKILLFMLATAGILSCSSKQGVPLSIDASARENELDLVDRVSSLFPLEVGNYWIYETIIKAEGEAVKTVYDTLRITTKISFNKVTGWQLGNIPPSSFRLGGQLYPISEDTLLSVRGIRTSGGNKELFITEFIFPKNDQPVSFFYNFGGDHGTNRTVTVDTVAFRESGIRSFLISSKIAEEESKLIITEGIGIVEASRRLRSLENKDAFRFESISKLISYKLK